MTHASAPLQLQVQGQHLDVGDALRGHVQSKMTDISSKYFNHVIHGDVHFAKEANGFRADIILSVGNGITLKASANNQDPYPAFDLASTKLTQQLKRYKERLRDHHAARADKDAIALGAPANEYTVRDDNEDERALQGDNPVILAEMPTQIETLSVRDAVMRMDLSDLPALMFKHAASGRLNVVYRRADTQIGWIDPQDAG